MLAVGGAACGESTNAPPEDVEASGGEAVRYEGSFTVLESPSHGPELCANLATSLPPQCGGLPVRNWDWDEVDGEDSRNGTTWGAWHVIGTYRDGALTLTERPGPPRDPVRRARDFAPACDPPDVEDPRAGEAAWEAATQESDFMRIDALVTMWVSGSGGPSEDFVLNVIVRPGAGESAKIVVRERYAGPLCVVERDLPLESELRALQSEVLNEDARMVLGQVQTAAADPSRGAVVAQVWVVDEAAATYVRERWGGLVILEPLLEPVG